MRLTLRADVRYSDPFTQADVAVEYGPVVIGGHTYNCPLHSVSLVSAYQEAIAFKGGGRDLGELAIQSERAAQRGPLQLLLNDIVFEGFHLFRGDTRMVTEPAEEPDR